jgi:hypothetical protein
MSEVVLVSLNAAGGNLGTIVQRIINEVSRTASADIDTTKMTVISAMRFFRDHRFWFNEGTHSFTMTVDQQEYEFETAETEGLPTDWVRPVTSYINITNTRWLEIDQVDIADIRWHTPTEQVVGIPSKWCYYNEIVFVTPIPSQADDLRFDYVRDLGTPSYNWNGTEWLFSGPAGEPLLDSFTSRWFTDAEELIRSRAKWDLYYNYLDDDQNAMKMGGMNGIGGAVGIAYNALKKTDNARRRRASRQPSVI